MAGFVFASAPVVPRAALAAGDATGDGSLLTKLLDDTKPLTLAGITIDGTVDVGDATFNHGAPVPFNRSRVGKSPGPAPSQRRG